MPARNSQLSPAPYNITFAIRELRRSCLEMRQPVKYRLRAGAGLKRESYADLHLQTKHRYSIQVASDMYSFCQFSIHVGRAWYSPWALLCQIHGAEYTLCGANLFPPCGRTGLGLPHQPGQPFRLSGFPEIPVNPNVLQSVSVCLGLHSSDNSQASQSRP